jgi:2-iminobutanoate/2-iminopropanoate deaminase
MMKAVIGAPATVGAGRLIVTLDARRPRMDRTQVMTVNAPAAIGPYSQAVSVGACIYCSGQLGLAPATNKLVEGGVAVETEQALRNLTAVLAAAGATLGHVVKTTVFMTDLARFADMNGVYEAFFPKPAPARSTVQVAALPRGATVEIEAIAVKP